MHRRESIQYMGSLSVPRNTTGSPRRRSIKGACPLLNGLSREPGWDVESGPEEDQNGAGIPGEAMTVIRGTDGGAGRSCCSGSIRNVWGGQKPPRAW